MKISLRKTIESDLEICYQNQTDATANFMAAFTPKDPFDRTAYIDKWTRLLHDATIKKLQSKKSLLIAE